ncbi:sporulation protein [Vibrio sp.]|nr:sporulation protein [Vibrio sp.]
MLNKIKASLGIGAAKVDTILDSMSYQQGDIITGVVHIFGGNVEQTVDAIHLKLCTEVKIEGENTHFQSAVMSSICANQPFTIQANEKREVPFQIPLHDETPITALNAFANQTKVWIETTLDIDFSIDPHDRDYLEITPLPVVQKVLSIMESNGYVMQKADVESGYLNGGHFQSTSGLYQEIEFQNRNGLASKEIELSFILAGEQVNCLVEIDKKFSMSQDTYTSFSLSKDASTGEIQARLHSFV